MMIESQCTMTENNIKDVPIKEEQKGPSDEKFTEFLEDNLESIINCPVSGTTFFNAVIGSDGFTYEDTVINEYVKRSTNPTSPITRESITKTFSPNTHIIELIKFSDKYDLEASKNKFINNDSFEENYEVIQNCILSGKYDDVYKFKKFLISFNKQNSLQSFCYKILSCDNIQNMDEYVKCIKYILDNSDDKEFVTNQSHNIFHIFFNKCRSIELIEYLFNIIPQEKHEEMLMLPSNQGSSPLYLSFDNPNKNVFPYLIEKNVGIMVSIRLVCIAIERGIDNNLIIKLIDKMDNVNGFYMNETSTMFSSIKMSNIVLIKYLIGKGYDMSAESTGGIHAIHYAVKYAKSDILDFILNMNVKYDVTIKFVNSCIQKKINNTIVTKLVARITNINEFDIDGMTMMFHAISVTNMELINYLLVKGYDTKLKVRDNLDTIHYAIKYGDQATITHLLDVCKEYEVTTDFINSCIAKNMNNELVKKMMEQLKDVNEFDINDMSMMFTAIKHKNIEIVDHLVTIGYDMNKKSINHLNTFHYVARYGNSEMVAHVLDMCESYNDISNEAEGWNIVHICCYYNSYDSIMYLMEKFVDLTIPIKQFQGREKSYVPVNLVEINETLKNDEREGIITYMFQLMELQMS